MDGRNSNNETMRIKLNFVQLEINLNNTFNGWGFYGSAGVFLSCELLYLFCRLFCRNRP